MQNRGEITEYISDGRLSNIGNSTVRKSVIRTRKEGSLCADKYRKKKDVGKLLKAIVRASARAPIWQILVRTARFIQ